MIPLLDNQSMRGWVTHMHYLQATLCIGPYILYDMLVAGLYDDLC
jgi:hypothetical protein